MTLTTSEPVRLTWPQLAGRLQAELAIIKITADAARLTWLAPGDGDILRQRLTEISERASQAAGMTATIVTEQED